MPASTIRRARSRASERLSSSRQARSGPDSSQQAMQRAVQRFVSCQARKRGAPYSPTARPGITESWAISGEADIRLGHHLLGDVLHLRRLPLLALAGAQLLALQFLLVLLALQVHFHVAHGASYAQEFSIVIGCQRFASACCLPSSAARRTAAVTVSSCQAPQ